MTNIPSFEQVQHLLDAHIDTVQDFDVSYIVGSEDFYNAFARLTKASEEIERAERLAEARRVAAVLRPQESVSPEAEIVSRPDLLALDDEITRLTGLLAERDATVQRVRDLHDLYFDPKNSEPGEAIEPEDVWRFDRDLRAALDPQKDAS